MEYNNSFPKKWFLVLFVVMHYFQGTLLTGTNVYNPVPLHEQAFQKIKEQLLNNMNDPRWPDYFERVKLYSPNLLSKLVNNYKRDDSVLEFNLIDQHCGIFLHEVIRSNQPKVMQVLLDNGISSNLQDYAGVCLLSCAVIVNANKIIQVLIDNDADVNSLDTYNFRPLKYAIRSGKKDIVQLLIKNGADANLKDRIGQTSLIHATHDTYSESPDFDIIQLLIANGADPMITDIYGKTARDYLIEDIFGHKAINYDDYNPELLKNFDQAVIKGKSLLYNSYRDEYGNIPEIN